MTWIFVHLYRICQTHTLTTIDLTFTKVAVTARLQAPAQFTEIGWMYINVPLRTVYSHKDCKTVLLNSKWMPAIYHHWLMKYSLGVKMEREHSKMCFICRASLSKRGLDVCGWHARCLTGVLKLATSHGKKRPKGERHSMMIMGWTFIMSSTGRNMRNQGPDFTFGCTGNYLHFPIVIQ